MKSDSEEFVRLLTEAQGPVYGYLLTLITDRNRARDLLQETNITIWKKADTFEEGTNFNAWACKIAYFHVLSFVWVGYKIRFQETMKSENLFLNSFSILMELGFPLLFSI